MMKKSKNLPIFPVEVKRVKSFTLTFTPDEVVTLLRGLALIGVFGKPGEDDDIISRELWHKIVGQVREDKVGRNKVRA